MSEDSSVSSRKEEDQDMEEEERKLPAVESQNESQTPPPTTRQAVVHRQMAKDPLDLGVPFPVLISRSEESGGVSAAFPAVAVGITCSAAATPPSGESAVAELDAAVARKLREEAVSLPTFTAANADDASKQRAQRGGRIRAVRRRGSSCSRSASSMGEDEILDIDDILEPGSYAIGGPGLSVPSPPPVAGDEEASYRFDVEQGRRHYSTDHAAPPNCSLETCTTTRISMSSHCSSYCSCSEISNDYLVEATLVPENREDAISERLSVVVQAEAKPLNRRAIPPWALFLSCCLFAILVIVGLMIGLAFLFELKSEDSDDEGMASYAGLTPIPTPSPSALSMMPTPAVSIEATQVRRPTLQTVRETGVLRCGVSKEVNDFISFVAALQGNQVDDNDVRVANNFSENYCRAIAAAVLGHGNSSHEIVAVQETYEVEALARNEVDVLIPETSMSMEQEANQDAAVGGLAYATPYLYTGIRFVGLPFYVNCADDGINTLAECGEIRICLHARSHVSKNFQLQIPQRNLIVQGNQLGLLSMFMADTCNVIATVAPDAIGATLHALNYEGELAIGSKEYTSGMWALSSLDGDPEWNDFLSVLTMGLLAAEEAGITRDEASKVGQTTLFGEAYKNMFIDALKESGNMGEIYDLPIPRSDKNLPNNGSSGLLMSPPLGDVEGPILAGHAHAVLTSVTAETIRNRGTLHCGVRRGRPGFASYDYKLRQWKGIDVDFCSALAASIFNGRSQAVAFHDVSVSGFVELDHGFIDVYAGAEWTIQNDVRENVTGAGFSFTQPYFYGPVNGTRFEENLCLATREDDPNWTSFVYWTAQSLVYAEENNISQSTSHLMPLVHCFGEDLQRMFRDAVHAMGNYKEVYDRNLADILPRGGRNMLNLVEENLPFRYIPPGLPF